MTTTGGYIYRSASTIVLWLTILLIAKSLIFTVVTFTTFEQIHLLESAKFGMEIPTAYAEAVNERHNLLEWIHFSESLPAGILFLMWVYRANRNAHALAAERLTYSPGWSVGWFFVPVANLFKPYRVFKEIWQASIAAPSNIWRQARVPPVLGAWWAVTVINVLIHVSRVRTLIGKSLTAHSNDFMQLDPQAMAADLTDLSDQLEYAWGLFVSDLVSIAAALMSVVIILTINEVQERRQGIISMQEIRQPNGVA